MHLTRQERSLLDSMIDHANEAFEGWQDIDYVIHGIKKLDSPLDYNVRLSMLEHLRDAGYAELRECDRVIYARLTYRGYEYKKFRGMELRDVWMNRFWGFLSGAALTGLAWFLSNFPFKK